MIIFTSGGDFKKFWENRCDVFGFVVLLGKDLRGKIQTRKLCKSLEYDFVLYGRRNRNTIDPGNGGMVDKLIGSMK